MSELADATSAADPQAQANALKEEGNKLLSAFNYVGAAEKYTAAIELFPTAIYYSNRAQALIKIESYGGAIADANEAIKLDPGYVKAYYRRASANFVLGKLKEAKKDFQAVVKIAPKDPDAQKKLKACEKEIRQEAFNKAIETNHAPPLALEDIESLAVDSGYTGPRLPDGANPPVSMEFVKEMISYMKEQKIVHRKYILQMLIVAREMFKNTSTLMRIPVKKPGDTSEDAPLNDHVIVCGDTHGQYYDLLNIFEIGGFPDATNPYLFNGDFVDRGSFSFEVVMTLIAIKLACPTALYMSRGNHETKNMNKIYGFEGEVKHKYDDVVMKLFTEVFNWLPLATVINDSVFCVHGGISTIENGAVELDAINALPRNCEPPESGLMSDLLWSDPQFMAGRSPSKRGVGFSFGPDITENFLNKNGLSLVVRSHEVKQEGYVVEHGGKCITVFSAPNYCDQMGNKGAFIRFEADNVPKFTQYEAVPHPNVPAMRYAGNIFGL